MVEEILTLKLVPFNSGREEHGRLCQVSPFPKREDLDRQKVGSYREKRAEPLRSLRTRTRSSLTGNSYRAGQLVTRQAIRKAVFLAKSV